MVTSTHPATWHDIQPCGQEAVYQPGTANIYPRSQRSPSPDFRYVGNMGHDPQNVPGTVGPKVPTTRKPQNIAATQSTRSERTGRLQADVFAATVLFGQSHVPRRSFGHHVLRPGPSGRLQFFSVTLATPLLPPAIPFQAGLGVVEVSGHVPTGSNKRVGMSGASAGSGFSCWMSLCDPRSETSDQSRSSRSSTERG